MPVPSYNYPTPGSGHYPGSLPSWVGKVATLNPYTAAAFGAYKLLGSLYHGIDNAAHPAEPWYQNAAGGGGTPAQPPPTAPSDPNTGGSDSPYYPPTWTSNGGYTPQPINSAGSLGQRAGNQEANFIADFNQLQSKGGEGFSRPDDIRPFGHAAYNATQANPAMLSAARRYMSAYPMGSTIPAIQNFNSSVSSGATPTWQQYLGRPAYTPPTAGRGFDFGTPPSPTGPVYGPPVPSSNPPPKMDLSGLISLWGKKG